jgi:hypothetical protein
MIKFDGMGLLPDFYQMPIYVCNDIYLITIYEKKLKGILWKLGKRAVYFQKNGITIIHFTNQHFLGSI